MYHVFYSEMYLSHVWKYCLLTWPYDCIDIVPRNIYGIILLLSVLVVDAFQTTMRLILLLFYSAYIQAFIRTIHQIIWWWNIQYRIWKGIIYLKIWVTGWFHLSWTRQRKIQKNNINLSHSTVWRRGEKKMWHLMRESVPLSLLLLLLVPFPSLPFWPRRLILSCQDLRQQHSSPCEVPRSLFIMFSMAFMYIYIFLRLLFSMYSTVYLLCSQWYAFTIFLYS